MNDFQPVTCACSGLGPGAAWNDLAVVLDRYSISLQAEFGDYQIEAGWLRERVKGSGMAVENKRKRHSSSREANLRAFLAGTPHPLPKVRKVFKGLKIDLDLVRSGKGVFDSRVRS